MHGEQSNEMQIHKPVLLSEVVGWLRPSEGGTFVDCTVGLGGHAASLLEASESTRLIGLDCDRDAIEIARERLSRFEGRAALVHASFSELDLVLERLGVGAARGVLADLGVSSLQLDRRERGFSFLEDAPLDMRMDAAGEETAAMLVNSLSENELADLIFEYGEERGSRKVARAIVRERDREPIATTVRLAEIVVRALKVRGRWRIHPATRTFQALRIAVNGELDALERLIPKAIDVLEVGGRLAIISFHSLEDRIVKRSFLRESGRCICEGPVRVPPADSAPGNRTICERCGASRRVTVLTRKPVRPSEAESNANPRARSALLRVCEKR